MKKNMLNISVGNVNKVFLKNLEINDLSLFLSVMQLLVSFFFCFALLEK